MKFRITALVGDRTVKRAIVALVLAAVAVAGAGCDPKHGSTKPPKPPSKDEQFRRDCRLRGGTPQIVHKDGRTSRVCIPPAKGW